MNEKLGLAIVYILVRDRYMWTAADPTARERWLTKMREVFQALGPEWASWAS